MCKPSIVPANDEERVNRPRTARAVERRSCTGGNPRRRSQAVDRTDSATGRALTRKRVVTLNVRLQPDQPALLRPACRIPLWVTHVKTTAMR